MCANPLITHIPLKAPKPSGASICIKSWMDITHLISHKALIYSCWILASVFPGFLPLCCVFATVLKMKQLPIRGHYEKKGLRLRRCISPGHHAPLLRPCLASPLHLAHFNLIKLDFCCSEWEGLLSRWYWGWYSVCMMAERLSNVMCRKQVVPVMAAAPPPPFSPIIH